MCQTQRKQIAAAPVANNTVLRQSERARSATPSSDVRYRKLSEFHASRRRPLGIFTGPMPPLSTGVLRRVVDKLRGRKRKRRPLQRRASGILHNVYRAMISSDGKQK